MSISLSVNLNKVALLRNSRTDNNPSIDEFAKLCIDAGADGLTAHPRPDQRHIRASDIPIIGNIAKAANVEFNIEGNPLSLPNADHPGLLPLVELALPQQCTFVPDGEGQLTSDHGFDLKKSGEKLEPIIAGLKTLGVRVSLFMDPDHDQIQLAKAIGADRIELYTGPFAIAFAKSPTQGQVVFNQHRAAAEFALSIGLGINAGHDLNIDNLTLYRTLPGLSEVSIGHALTADALRSGFHQAVKSYLALCQE